ncbi:MAG: CRTAC1 family protein [Acidobacteriota bacterium]
MSRPAALWVSLALAVAAASGAEGAAKPGSVSEDDAPPASGALAFEDVTERSGLDFHGPHSKEKRFILESVSGGVALLDLDGDGWLDLFLVDSLTVETAARPELARSSLYRNLGKGKFENVTEASGIPRLGWGVGVCAGDVDGDGKIDLYVTCVERNHLLRHLGDLRFEDITERAGVRAGGWSTGCAFADADRDGDLDLFVARYLDLQLDQLPAFGEGEICRYRGVPVQCGPRGLPGQSDLYFRNDGSGRFEEASKAAGLHDDAKLFGLGVTWLDVERDGWLDLYVANDTGANYLYINRRDGTFEESAHLWGVAVTENGKEQGSMGVAVGDTLNDGWPDLFVTNFSEEYNALYRNRKGEYYTDASFRSRLAYDNLPYVGWGTAFLDADNDGWLDLVWLNGHVYPQMDDIELEASAPYLQRSMLYRNAHDGTFSAVRGGALEQERAARGLAVGDIDNDGRLDLVTTDLDAEARILRNVSTDPGHWLIVELRARGPRHHILGAHLTARAGDLTLTRWVTSGSSYLSQSALRQHFGLGDAKRVEKIDVEWPDGSRSSHGPFEADRIVRLAQP